MREASIQRKTNETNVSISLNLDGRGQYDNQSGCGFLDHMLDLFTRHGRFDLTVRCQGDTKVDDHHTVEDVAIVLGQCFAQALADKKGITRYGSMVLPMDEALLLCAVDLSGRCALNFDVSLPTQKVGSFDTELCEEFFFSLSRTMGANLHIKQLAGSNSHHIIEGIFKAMGRALKQAAAIDPEYADEIPSTKGMLE